MWYCTNTEASMPNNARGEVDCFAKFRRGFFPEVLGAFVTNVCSCWPLCSLWSLSFFCAVPFVVLSVSQRGSRLLDRGAKDREAGAAGEAKEEEGLKTF